MDNVINIGKELGNGFKDLGSALGDLLKGKDIGKNAFKLLTGNLGQVIDLTKDFHKGIFNNIKDSLKGIGKSLKGIFGSEFTDLSYTYYV